MATTGPGDEAEVLSTGAPGEESQGADFQGRVALSSELQPALPRIWTFDFSTTAMFPGAVAVILREFLLQCKGKINEILYILRSDI